MSELARILDLPTRPDLDAEAIAAEITRQFKTPNGTQTLRPLQGLALYELATQKGLLAAIRVGGGKTLISLLAPTVFDSRRCVLILPAALIAKTERDREAYAKHWKVATQLRIISYELLGRPQAATWLEDFGPDLIIADECHRLKNPRAAVSKRVTRFMRAHPTTKFVALSGTIVKKSIKDYAHLTGWALKEGSPLPLNNEEIEAWAEIIDEDDNFLIHRDLSRLKNFGRTVSEIREGFKQRLIKTPGCIVSTEGRGCSSSLLLRAVDYEQEAIVDEHFKNLRNLWTTPDGWPLSDPMAVWRHARELALSLHYIWDPRPPSEWLDARRAWASYVRSIIVRSRTYDSEKQVADAVKNGDLLCPEFWTWDAIQPTFIPNPKPVWHGTKALEVCEAWSKSQGGGIIWSIHSFFGKELARRTGWEYFGKGGVNSIGRPIEDTSPAKDGTVIASMYSCGTGRNLQAWSKALITAPPPGGDVFEQLLGRLHREGQLADEVSFDFLYGCKEHDDALRHAQRDAQMIHATTAQDQKLLWCDVDMPADKPEIGWRWNNADT